MYHTYPGFQYNESAYGLTANISSSVCSLGSALGFSCRTRQPCANELVIAHGMLAVYFQAIGSPVVLKSHVLWRRSATLMSLLRGAKMILGDFTTWLALAITHSQTSRKRVPCRPASAGERVAKPLPWRRETHCAGTTQAECKLAALHLTSQTWSD